VGVRSTALWIAAAVVVAVSPACSLVIKEPFSLMTAGSVSSGTLSRTQALEDLDSLIRLLENVHPDPYRFVSRDRVQAERQHQIDTVPASLSKAELCTRLSAVAAIINDGHTEVLCHALVIQEWERAAKASPSATQTLRMFPPYMRLDDRQRLIIGWPNDAPGLERGDRLVRVNGHDATALLATFAREVSHDTEAGHMAKAARWFRMHLALHGIDAPYQVTVARAGVPNREVTIRGEPVNYWFDGRPPAVLAATQAVPALAQVTVSSVSPPVPKSPELQTAWFTYRALQPGIAYMDFFSMADGSAFGAQGRFRKAVDAMFRRIASDQPRTLIIDIRENNGGDSTIVEELFRHITGKPFRISSASTQVKRSQEVRDMGQSLLRKPFRWLPLPYLVKEGRVYYRGEVGSLSAPDEEPIKTRPRAEPFFAGPVCVLTGPHTFSAAVEMAETVKVFGLAAIIGEETGGQPNSFGNAPVFPLPHSRLPVQIATARAVRGSGDATDFSPVIPDVIVRTTAEEIRSGFDPVIERAKNCPAR
jgi:hypothetical protein